MRRGDSFTDISEQIVREPYQVTDSTTIYTDTIINNTVLSTEGGIDLASHTIKRDDDVALLRTIPAFNSFRLSWMIGTITSDVDGKLELLLRHSNVASGAWEWVGDDDIIGPTEPITDGVYKILDGNIKEKGLYNDIYSVGYVGGKQYISGMLRTTLFTGTVDACAWVTKMLINNGKCTDKYPLIS
jgi:hypothetical protein